MAARVALGRISGVFGIKGWVKVHSYTRPIENVFEYERWWLEGAANATVAPFEAKLVEGRPQGSALVAHLTDADGRPMESREAAARFVGAGIYVERAALPPAPEGSYYWSDLVGLQVRSLSGAVLGRIEALTDNGAQDVLVVRNGEETRLIPFVRGPIVKAVDLEQRDVTVAWEPDY